MIAQLSQSLAGMGWRRVRIMGGVLVGIACMVASMHVAAAVQSLSPQQTLLIEHACERLSADYAYAVDANNPEAVASVFAEDGVWQLRDVYKGRKAIRDYMQEFVTTKTYTSVHLTTNIRIQVIDENHATGTASVQLYRYDPANLPAGGFMPTALGTFNDEFVRTPEGWRFLRRELKAISAKR